MRVMRGSVWSLRSTRSGQKKYRAGEKGADSKIEVGPPIPIYIASDRIPSQHVGVGLAQARPNQVLLVPSSVYGLIIIIFFFFIMYCIARNFRSGWSDTHKSIYFWKLPVINRRVPKPISFQFWAVNVVLSLGERDC